MRIPTKPFFPAIFCACLACRASAFSLTVLHTNDIHAAYSGFTESKNTCYENHCKKGFGGFVRLKRTVDALRLQEKNVLVFDGGDQVQGSLFTTLFGEKPSAALMREIGYDAVTLGNHEFDQGRTYAGTYLRELPGRVLCANIEGIKDLKPWKILERDGHRIGVVGLLTPDTSFLSKPDPDTKFLDPNVALTKAIGEMRNLGAETVIVLSHLGLDIDRKICHEFSGISLWVSAHTHTFLGDHPEAAGPYPILEKDKDGRQVALVSTGHSGQCLGVIRLEIDDKGLKEAQGDALWLDDALLTRLHAKPLPDATKSVYDGFFERVLASLGGKLGVIRGATTAALDSGDPMRCRKRTCEMGEITTEAMRELAQADVSLVNSGAIRTTFPGDAVYEGHSKAVFPFNNHVLRIPKMQGRIIRSAIEHGIANFGPGKGSGRFLQTAGLSYTFDPQRAPGNRLLTVAFHPKYGKAIPLDDNRFYSVATTDYVMRGGDGYAMMKGIAYQDTQAPIDATIGWYLKRHPSFALTHRPCAESVR